MNDIKRDDINIDVDRIVWDVRYREEVKNGLRDRKILSALTDQPDWQQELDFSLSFATAFQPIVDVRERSIFAYEALVRDRSGHSVGHFFDMLGCTDRYVFDHLCRIQAIKDAVRLKMDTRLSLNFLPNSVGQASCSLQRTLAFATKAGFPTERLIFEISEKESHADLDFFSSYLESFVQQVSMAIDDFGQGYSGLSLLASVQPHMVKLDMALVRGIQRDARRQAILDTIVELGRRLDMTLIAEGVETEEEASTLLGLGITLMQGYFFVPPMVERLPRVVHEKFQFCNDS